MDKISSPKDLQAELHRLMEYCQGSEPSREKLASELKELASRIEPKTAASADSIIKELAQEAASIIERRGRWSPDVEKGVLRMATRYAARTQIRDPKALTEDLLYVANIKVHFDPRKLKDALEPYIVEPT